MTINYELLNHWELYSNDIMVEYRQCYEEGKDVEKYSRLAAEINELPVGRIKEEMAGCLGELMLGEKIRNDYAYFEPSVLDDIKSEREKYSVSFQPPSDLSKLSEKIKGAWVGRICGCLLGKTVEGIKISELLYVLKETGNYPMSRYILKKELTDEIYEKTSFPLIKRCFADTVECAPSDDDTNYTALSVKLINQYGRGFTAIDLAKCWLSSQPRNAYCTAERVAFRNFINGYYPPNSAVYKNPYREWIGAQIRSDYYGYINPGDPELAADMAWRDASVSHVKNGIYGSMFVAAMLACAAVYSDIKTVIYGGLAEIPRKSRLYEAVSDVIESFDKGHSYNECIAMIHKRYDDSNSHDWCHTISNAMIVVAALLHGGLDYGKSVCMAVEPGFDTDCNGATVGSIVGMIIGIGTIPEEWVKPINNKLDTSIIDMGCVSVDYLIEQTMKHMKVEE